MNLCEENEENFMASVAELILERMTDQDNDGVHQVSIYEAFEK